MVLEKALDPRNNLNWSELSRMKPRILLCAPSNAAVDNVLCRIMEQPFLNGDGLPYWPRLVRVGAGGKGLTMDQEKLIQERVNNCVKILQV